MRNKRTAETMTRLLRHARYEVLPTASTEDKVLAHVPQQPGHRLGVPLVAHGATRFVMRIRRRPL